MNFLKWLFSLFQSHSKEETQPQPLSLSKEIITLDTYFMGRREKYSSEFNQSIQDNAIVLLGKINAFLNELGIKEAIVTSGWRPNSLNQTIPNAAQKSNHTLGKACDIKDDGTLDSLCEKNPELLRKYGLWLESPGSTLGWTHLDDAIRTDRPSRVFLP